MDVAIVGQRSSLGAAGSGACVSFGMWVAGIARIVRQEMALDLTVRIHAAHAHANTE